MDKVVHFEMPAGDINRAIKFYKEVFGWDIQKAGPVPYWIITTVQVDDNRMPKEAGAINGGMLMKDEKNDPGSSNPVLVINVNNVKNYCEKVKAKGGHVILTARKVMDMGIYARVKDTEGNIIGLWQNLH